MGNDDNEGDAKKQPKPQSDKSGTIDGPTLEEESEISIKPEKEDSLSPQDCEPIKIAGYGKKEDKKMWTWESTKDYLRRINWLKVVMALFTLIVLISYGIATVFDEEIPALAKLNYFYKWAIGAFALLHEAQRWFASDKDKPSITIVQGEVYVMLFILTTICLLFYNVICSDLYPNLPNALNDLIELSIWVAGAFGFSRLSKNFSETKQANNLAKLAGTLNKMGFKAPQEPPTGDPK